MLTLVLLAYVKAWWFPGADGLEESATERRHNDDHSEPAIKSTVVYCDRRDDNQSPISSSGKAPKGLKG